MSKSQIVCEEDESTVYFGVVEKIENKGICQVSLVLEEGQWSRVANHWDGDEEFVRSTSEPLTLKECIALVDRDSSAVKFILRQHEKNALPHLTDRQQASARKVIREFRSQAEQADEFSIFE